MYEVLQAFGDDLEIDGRLIGLLNSLEKLSDVTDKDGHPIKAGMGWSGIFWRDLSGLAVILRESAFGKHTGILFGWFNPTHRSPCR